MLAIELLNDVVMVNSMMMQFMTVMNYRTVDSMKVMNPVL